MQHPSHDVLKLVGSQERCPTAAVPQALQVLPCMERRQAVGRAQRVVQLVSGFGHPESLNHHGLWEHPRLEVAGVFLDRFFKVSVD